MDDERVKQVLGKVQQEYVSLKEEFGDTSLEPCTLNAGQNSTNIYLSTQQTDLLLLVNAKTPEELIGFVNNCVQVSNYQVGDVNESNLEDKKREVFDVYLKSFASFKDLAPREGFTEKDSSLTRIRINLQNNLPESYHQEALNALSTGGEQGLVNYLITLPNGDKYIRDIGRFISIDYENIQGVTYEEIVALDELIKRDPTIKGIISIAAKYDMTMHYGADGVKQFDPYYLDRVMAYCKITGKHMRYHSLFDRSTAMDFKAMGLDKEGVMRRMTPFADGFFEYLSRHNETLEDGTRLIDCAEIFNELLCYEPGVKNTGMVWQEYFGMSMEDLFSFIIKDGVSRVPDGVEVMYNETALEEGMARLQSCDSIIRDIYRVAPGFINVFGNQLHVYDSLFSKDNIHMLNESNMFMKHVQDDFGIRVQISEHDLNINGDLVSNCQKYGIPLEYLRLLKKKYQKIISDSLVAAGLDINTVDYWSIFDKVDHNLRRYIEARIKRGESIQGIDSLHAGLIPEESDISHVQSLNPDAYEKQLTQNQNKVKKLEYPTEAGSISIVLVMIGIIVVLLSLIIISIMVV